MTAAGGVYQPVPDYYSPVSPLTPDVTGGPELGNPSSSGPRNATSAAGAIPKRGPTPEVVVSRKKKGKQKQKQTPPAATASAETAETTTKSRSSSSQSLAKKTAPSSKSQAAGSDMRTEQPRPSADSPAPVQPVQEDSGAIVSGYGQQDAQADDESLRLWRKTDEEDNAETTSPAYNLEGDEFRNVWGGSGSPDR